MELAVRTIRGGSIQIAWTASCLSALIACAPTSAAGERLPIKRYTMQDGLANDRIKCIVQDSRGFLWVCTARGLNRFDGARFVTYTVDDGLPNPSINDLLERRDGSYWIATNGGGVAHMIYERAPGTGDGSNVSRRPRFTVHATGDIPRANRVNVLHEDRAGRIWAGTDAGVFLFAHHAPEVGFRPIALDLPGRPDTSLQIWDFAEDTEGHLWIATSWGVVRRFPDGRTAHLPVRPAQGSDIVRGLALDGENRVWAAHTQGLMGFSKGGPGNTLLRDARWMQPEARLPDGPFLAVSAAAGRIWLGSVGGLGEIAGREVRAYGRSHGLGDDALTVVTEDRERNLWIGTRSAGIMKLSRAGFTSYGIEDGLRSPHVAAVIDAPGGEIYVATDGNFIHRFDGRTFVGVRPNLPRHLVDTGRRTVPLVDRRGELWVPTGDGLYRFPAVRRLEELSRIPPTAVYTTAHGLADSDVFRLFEDSRGDIWISGWAPGHEVLTRWDRRTEKFHRYSASDGLPAFSTPLCFAEDRFGAVWIGFREGTLVRARPHGFDRVTIPGSTAGSIGDLYSDRSGRMWVASPAGAGRIDRPDADVPLFVTYSTAEGLSTPLVNRITEDSWGRMYFGTANGVDQLDVASGRVTHYTAADGLSGSDLVIARRDRTGALWFGMYSGGLARFTPDPPRDLTPPSIFIADVRVAGTSVAADHLGVAEITGLKLGPSPSQVQVEYFGLASTLDEAIRYQYKLEGAESVWSAPTTDRFVSYPRLAPGNYRFLVRAIASGVSGTMTASVSFSVASPVWQRWWFIAAGLALMATAVYALSRFRLTRQLELERIRTRIATDLHDDVGSSLSQIAILSEVARQRAGQLPAIDEPLSKISASSRELVDTMSDIVWAISPHRDSLRDLTYRMRRFAADTFTAASVSFRFTALGTEETTRIGAEVRRDVYLMFKESVNNIVRHARCETASVVFRAEDGWLVLRVADDGVGFAEAADEQGYGLTSLRQRAARLHGTVRIESSPGQGTTVTFRIPMHRAGARRRSPTRSGGDVLQPQP